MTDPTETDVRPAPIEDTPEQLGLSYGALLAQEAWEVDVPPVLNDTDNRTPAAAKNGAGTAPPPLARIVEALLFVGGAPLTPERAGETVRGLTPGQFRRLRR